MDSNNKVDDVVPVDEGDELQMTDEWQGGDTIDAEMQELERLEEELLTAPIVKEKKVQEEVTDLVP